MKTPVHVHDYMFFQLRNLGRHFLSKEDFHIFFPISSDSFLLPMLRILNVYRKGFVIGYGTPNIKPSLVAFLLLRLNSRFLSLWCQTMKSTGFTFHASSIKKNQFFLWNSLAFSSICGHRFFVILTFVRLQCICRLFPRKIQFFFSYSLHDSV